MQKYDLEKQNAKSIIEKKRTGWKRKRQIVVTKKANCPDQNNISLTNKELWRYESLLPKDPIFVPTMCNINWQALKPDFGNFVNLYFNI